jgi:hypothetical protein
MPNALKALEMKQSRLIKLIGLEQMTRSLVKPTVQWMHVQYLHQQGTHITCARYTVTDGLELLKHPRSADKTSYADFLFL